MPFTSCVSFVLYAGKRRSCPLRLIAALGIGFRNVPLTDPFDVLFVRRIYLPMPERITCSSESRLQIQFKTFRRKWEIVPLFSLAFYLLRYFILEKYDRLRANNVSVNNELHVSAMLV